MCEPVRRLNYIAEELRKWGKQEGGTAVLDIGRKHHNRAEEAEVAHIL